MNRDDIIRMAREAGIDTLNGLRDDNTSSVYYEAWPEQLERFAALVAAAERDACAQECIEVGATKGNSDDALDMADACAAAIRARGEK